MLYKPTGVDEVELTNIILDLNGTLAVNGELVEGVKERLNKLKELKFSLYLFTGDQRGNAAMLASEIGIEVQKATTSDEKEALTNNLDVSKTVAIGNARIDIGTFRSCKLRIGTLQAEGIHVGIIPYIDILVPTINNALDLLIYPDVFNATMRK